MAYENCLGMMGWGGGYGSIMMLLYIFILIGIVVLLYLWIVKLWRELSPKKKK